MRLRVLVLDDNQEHSAHLAALIQDIPEIDFAGVFHVVPEFINAIKEQSPDLLFIDIKLDKVSGFDVIKSLNPRPLVVFVSSHPEYAVESFDFEPLNYIVKPVNYLDVLKSIERAKRSLQGLPHEYDYVFIKSGHSNYIKVHFKDILFIQADGDFVKIHTTNKKITAYFSLKQFQKHLPDSFIQTHRSYLVNPHQIDNFTTEEIRIRDFNIPISKSYRQEVENALIKNRVIKR